MPFQPHFGSTFSAHIGRDDAENNPPVTAGASSQSKPIRLALACNQCRKRKVRCDAQQPKCRNCSLRGDICETSDPRKPGDFPAVRRRATKRWQSKSGRDAEPTLSPTCPSPVTFTPSGAPISATLISSVLNPADPVPNNVTSPASSRARRSSINPALPVSSVSPASSSWQKDRSERLGEDHFSWQSRAYQESTVAQGQDVGPGHSPNEQGALVTPVTHDEPEQAEDTANKTKYLGASSVQSLFNFVDLHLARYGFNYADPLFRYGMMHTDDFPMPLIPKFPLLPDQASLSTYSDAFFSRLWPIYPILDRESFDADQNTIIALQSGGPSDWKENVTSAHLPALASVYAITSLGINEISENSELSFEYLTASHSLHGHLTAVPYMTSVQSLFLLSLALRAAGRDGQAWHIIGHAVRMAQSVGLNKSSTANSSEEGVVLGAEPETLRQRLWWSCFALEKLMQLECGRPSVFDRSHDSISFNRSDDKSPDRALPYFQICVELSGIMGRILNQLYSHKFMGGSAELLGVVARLDQELTEWVNSLPNPLKPLNASMEYASDEQKVISIFLSQQYYQAQLSVLRVALIFPQKSLETEVRKHKAKLPLYSRLLNGASICANAARSIITQSLHLADSGLRSTLLAAPPTYLSSVVLALGALRQPNSRLVTSDVELLASATEFVETWYLRRGFAPAFTQPCTHLRERLISIFQRSGGNLQKPMTVTSVEKGTEAIAGQHPQPDITDPYNAHANHSQDLSAQWGSKRAEPFSASEQSADLFSDFEFEDLYMMDLDCMIYDDGSSFVAQ